MENNKNKIKGLIIAIVIMSLLVIGLGSYIVYDKFIKEEPNVEEKESNTKEEKDNNKKEDNKSEEEKTPWEKFVENKKRERTEKIIFERKDDDRNYNIKITKDGKILMTNDSVFVGNSLESVEDFEIFNNVLFYYISPIGHKDICEGDESIFVIKEDGTISSLSIDYISCGQNIITSENIGQLKNIVDVYNEKEYMGEYIPYNYKVFAKDINGTITEISDLVNYDEE